MDGEYLKSCAVPCVFLHNSRPSKPGLSSKVSHAGVNGTIFAYGVTSSGKTHTMSGTATDQGVIGRAIADVFAAIERMPGRDFLLRLSMMEIYNEVPRPVIDPMTVLLSSLLSVYHHWSVSVNLMKPVTASDLTCTQEPILTLRLCSAVIT